MSTSGAAAAKAPLTFEEVYPDILKVIENIAHKYTDPSCMELNYEELRAEGLRKLVHVLNKDILDKLGHKRGELFAFLKTCINNHLKGIVGRCRFTIKRTGLKPPPKGECNVDAPPRIKPEVWIDDPDVHVQLPADETGDVDEVVRDMQELLNPIEFLVYKQLTSPNPLAAIHAYLSSCVGKRRRKELLIDETAQAAGLGITLELFQTVKQSLQTKVKAYMDDNSTNPARSAAISALEQRFNLHIPRSTDPIVVKRLLTIAARHNYEQVDQSVIDLLTIAGAKPPIMDGESMDCYGVLHSNSNKTCLSCGLREQCRTESANFGLDVVVLAPGVLPARASVRTARLTDGGRQQEQQEETTQESFVPGPIAIEDEDSAAPATEEPAAQDEISPGVHVPTPQPGQAQVKPLQKLPKIKGIDAKKRAHPTCTRDEVIMSTLLETWKSVTFAGELYFKHRTPRTDGSVKHVFWLGRKADHSPFSLRFCGASDAIAAQLVKVGKSYYAPVDMPEATLIKLMTKHSDELWKS